MNHNNPLDDSVASFFSYDPHGNVEWAMKVIPGLGANYIGYSYDLYSGSMRRVDYNDGWTDQYHQRYSYDEDNRIRLVESSRDGRIWDRDARYHYYLHGPLRRVELGEDSVQALDYLYTIEGWLKGINHPTLDTAQDPGNDGKVGPHRNVARDLFGMVLGYYAGDYERAYGGTNSPFNSGSTAPATNLNGRPLYNGNISSWTSQTMPAPTTGPRPIYEQLTGSTYRYDVLNRLLSDTLATYGSSTWSIPGNRTYQSYYSYDPAGNILTLERRGDTVKARMDELAYHYTSGTNRLDWVYDSVPSNFHTVDIDAQSSGNYLYDGSGNLVMDVSEGIVVKWNAQGKVEKVKKRLPGTGGSLASGTAITIEYLYDPAGQRVRKVVINDKDSSQSRATYYVRDANEQVLAIYEGDWHPIATFDSGCALVEGLLDNDCDGVPDAFDNCPWSFNPSMIRIHPSNPIFR